MIILIGESPIETMSLSLFEYISKKTKNVEYVLQETIPFQNKITYYAEDGKLKGNFQLNNKNIDFSDINAVYTRMADAQIPDIDAEEIKNIIKYERDVAFNIMLEYIDAMVINRTRSQITNSSKLYQSWIIKKYGFMIPDSISSNDAKQVKEFIKQHKKDGVIYKSISSERSEVRELVKSDIKNLSSIEYCPNLFQQKVAGVDIRVHAIATGEVFACEINSSEDDYRYDKNRSIVPIKIPKKVADACVKMTLDLGLYISGIDLRRTDKGEYYCFEVNPSPAFSWYEMQTGLPIAKAIGDMMINSDKYKNLPIRKY